jgi:phenylalanyl-tRNA synthetase alpha subunit
MEIIKPIMTKQTVLNKNITPAIFPEHGGNSEKVFQERLRQILLNLSLREVKSSFITNEFYSFDILGFPQYLMLRTKKNILYYEENEIQQINDGLFESIKLLHKERFGYDLDRHVSEKSMLLSHTTSTIVESLINFGPDELFVISKTFRSKSEKAEKTQVDICLRDRTLPEVISFVENLYEILLNRKIKIRLTSDFYFFCEPSFSFEVSLEGSDKKFLLGSGGFIRDECLNLINKKHSKDKARNIIFIGFPYQKILNMVLGEKFDNWNIDYNTTILR